MPAGTLYRGREGMWSWVAHRVTGVLIFFFLFVHVLDTALVRVSPEAYDDVVATYKTPIVALLEYGLVAAGPTVQNQRVGVEVLERAGVRAPLVRVVRQQEGEIDTVSDGLAVDTDDPRADLEAQLVGYAARFDVRDPYHVAFRSSVTRTKGAKNLMEPRLAYNFQSSDNRPLTLMARWRQVR